MATKKKASGQQSSSKALQPWEERMAAKAAQAAESASSTGGTSLSIGTRGGRFKIDGAEVPDNALRAVVLDFLVDVTYYEDDFDPDDITPPTAFALGRNEKELVWDDTSHPDYAGQELRTSPVFQWGSADKGRGKAAKSRRRLLLISEDDLEEDIANAEVRKLMVPVTSGKSWDAYVKKIKAHNLAPCGVLTEITIVPDDKYQFRLEFKMLGRVDDDSMSEVLDKVDSIQDDLFAPYSPYDEVREDDAPAKGGAKAVAKGAAKRGGKAAKGRR